MKCPICDNEFYYDVKYHLPGCLMLEVGCRNCEVGLFMSDNSDRNLEKMAKMQDCLREFLLEGIRNEI